MRKYTLTMIFRPIIRPKLPAVVEGGGVGKGEVAGVGREGEGKGREVKGNGHCSIFSNFGGALKHKGDP